MALQELVIVNPSRKTTKRRRTNKKRNVKNMARRKVSRRTTPARRKTTARRKTARKTTTRRRKAPARRKTTKRKTTTRRRKAPARRKTTRRKTTTRRRKAPARRKTTRRKTTTRRRKAPARRKTTRRRKSPARRKTTRRKTTRRRKSPARRRTSRRRSVSRRKTASRRRSVSRKMSIKAAMKWTRTNLMKFEMMAALAGGLAISSTLPLLVEGALAKVGITGYNLTTGYKGAAVSLAAAGVGGYALYSLAGVSAQTAGLFTVAAMLPAALLALNTAGLNFLPTITVQNNPFSAAAANGLYGILGNPSSVIDEPLFGGYHDGMHAGAHMPVMSGHAGDMFGLGGKEINLF
jgi:hypothetical protein